MTRFRGLWNWSQSRAAAKAARSRRKDSNVGAPEPPAEPAEEVEEVEEEAEEAEEEGSGGVGEGEGEDASREEAAEELNPRRRMVCAPDGSGNDAAPESIF